MTCIPAPLFPLHRARRVSFSPAGRKRNGGRKWDKPASLCLASEKSKREEVPGEARQGGPPPAKKDAPVGETNSSRDESKKLLRGATQGSKGRSPFLLFFLRRGKRTAGVAAPARALSSVRLPQGLPAGGPILCAGRCGRTAAPSVQKSPLLRAAWAAAASLL